MNVNGESPPLRPGSACTVARGNRWSLDVGGNLKN